MSPEKELLFLVQTGRDMQRVKQKHQSAKGRVHLNGEATPWVPMVSSFAMALAFAFALTRTLLRALFGSLFRALVRVFAFAFTQGWSSGVIIVVTRGQEFALSFAFARACRGPDGEGPRSAFAMTATSSDAWEMYVGRSMLGEVRLRASWGRGRTAMACGRMA